MTIRREARGIATGTAPAGRIPRELLSVEDPTWRDEEALCARFPDLVDDAILNRLRMGGRVHNQMVGRWCVANGLLHKGDDRRPDWKAFRRLAGGRDDAA